MTLTITPVHDAASLAEMAALFCADAETDYCWCMWFIIPVKDFHAGGAVGNRAAFEALAERSVLPLGLLAYVDGAAVGWCAVGPRSRYARAIKTPTYKGRNPAEDATVWLAPCFYVRPEARAAGVTQALLRAAVDLARAQGAVAIEGFPLVAGQRQAKDTQVGFQPVFDALGFKVIAQPSSNRVVMRLGLTG